MESRSVCNSNYFIVSAIARQLKDCTAIDKENIFQDPDRESSGTGHIGLSRCLRVRADILP